MSAPTNFKLGKYSLKDAPEFDAHVTAVVTKTNGITYLVGFIQKKRPIGSGLIVPMLWAASGSISEPVSSDYWSRSKFNLVSPAPVTFTNLYPRAQEAVRQIVANVSKEYAIDAIKGIIRLEEAEIREIYDYVRNLSA